MTLKVGDLIPIGGGGYSLLSNIEGFAVDSVDDGTVRLIWKDPEDVYINGTLITSWEGTQIRRKTGNYPVNEKDGELVVDSKVRNQYETAPYENIGLTNNVEYFYMAFPYTDKNVFTVDSANRVSAIPTPSDDTSGSPGSGILIGGDMTEGFFGEVPASELITGDALASEVGISAGTSQNSTAGWLKFALDDKILFVAKKPIRHTISWDYINAADCVYGNKTVVIGGLTYKVRLMKGALTDPSLYDAADRGAIGSEWNRLMLPIHVNAPSSWAHPAYVASPTKDWGIDYTDTDLVTINTAGDGFYSWCQEVRNTSASYRVYRGGGGVSGSGAGSSSGAGAYYGWRPALELVI